MTRSADGGQQNERTEVYYGQEEAMRILLQTMRNVKREAVVCSDANSPAFSMGIEPVKAGYAEFKRNGIKVKQIVEITKDNLQYCKEFMNYVELRHMDNIKGNMAVSETEYVATAVLEGAVPVTQTIYSNVKGFLEQQRYFFANLWSKAIPAEQKIREIEENIPIEKTTVERGVENATATIVGFLTRASRKMDICADQTWPSVAMGVPVFKEAMLKLKPRKIRCRFVTEFTKGNLVFCKELMEIAEVRHLDIKGNFAVSEREYIASATMKAQQLLPQVIYSNVKEVVEQEQYIFETIWYRALPAEIKIKELEQKAKDLKPFIENIYACTKCVNTFVTRDDLDNHRQTSGHRDFYILPFTRH